MTTPEPIMIPIPTLGRGAWTRTGKDNSSIYYEYIVGKPLDGSNPNLDVNYLAVNQAVKAYQTLINARGYSPLLSTDGVFGARTQAGVKWLQTQLGLTPDGKLGANTSKLLWRPMVAKVAADRQVDPHHLWGMLLNESSADTGAVGYYTPSDRGLTQINVLVHTEVTPQMAHDPTYNLIYAAYRLFSNYSKYGGKGEPLRTYCAIANHNSPVSADKWYANGYPPTEKIATYVTNVLNYGTSW